MLCCLFGAALINLLSLYHVLFWPAVSFEVPDLPEVPDVALPSPVAQSMIAEKEKLSRTVSSSSSTTSSCSSFHLPLSKTSRYCSERTDLTVQPHAVTQNRNMRQLFGTVGLHCSIFLEKTIFVYFFPSAQLLRTVVPSSWWKLALWVAVAPPGAAQRLTQQDQHTQTQHPAAYRPSIPALFWSLTLLLPAARQQTSAQSHLLEQQLQTRVRPGVPYRSSARIRASLSQFWRDLQNLLKH